MQRLRLDNFGIQQSDDHQLIYGHVGGEKLYFKTLFDPDRNTPAPRPRAEPFICALLMPAMQAGVTLEIPAELQASRTFLDNIGVAQEIFSSWYPELSKVPIDVNVDVDVDVASAPAEAGNSHCATFFSGGVDACYTLLKEQDKLTHLVYARGIDMQLDKEALWQQCLAHNQQIADRFNKTLVAVETNVRFFIRRISSPDIGWNQAVGTGMASLAHSLGFARTLISSSNTYNALHPYGSHPLTDPLFSSEAVQIIHNGCEASRHEKLMRVANDERLLPHLRVCWQDNGFNCGHCDKCLHFRMALRLLNLRAGGLDPLTDFSELRHAHTGNLGEYIEWEDNLVLARKVGDRAADKALQKILNRYKRKQLLKLADELLLNGRLLALRQRRT